MPDPFKLTWRMLVAAFKITGYIVVFVGQAGWYVAHGRRDKVGDAIEQFGKSTVDAMGDVLKD